MLTTKVTLVLMQKPETPLRIRRWWSSPLGARHRYPLSAAKGLPEATPCIAPFSRMSVGAMAPSELLGVLWGHSIKGLNKLLSGQPEGRPKGRPKVPLYNEPLVT